MLVFIGVTIYMKQIGLKNVLGKCVINNFYFIYYHDYVRVFRLFQSQWHFHMVAKIVDFFTS